MTTPTLISFFDVDDNLRYISIDSIETIKFTDCRESNIEKIYIRCRSGAVIECGVFSTIAMRIKKKLNSFVI